MPPFTLEELTIPKERHRINIWFFLTLTVLMIGEIVQIVLNFAFGLIPFFGWLIGWIFCAFIALGLFGAASFWRVMHDVRLFDSIKKIILLAITMFFELFPLLNALPTASLSFIFLGIIVWLQDRAHNRRVRKQRRELEVNLKAYRMMMRRYPNPARAMRAYQANLALAYQEATNDTQPYMDEYMDQEEEYNEYLDQEEEYEEENPMARVKRFVPMTDIRNPRYQPAANDNRQYVDQAA